MAVLLMTGAAAAVWQQGPRRAPRRNLRIVEAGFAVLAGPRSPILAALLLLLLLLVDLYRGILLTDALSNFALAVAVA
jgi:hypothetical protein